MIQMFISKVVVKTSTVTKKDTTTTNAPTVCVIDDEEVHEHYKMASNTCRDQKSNFKLLFAGGIHISLICEV